MKSVLLRCRNSMIAFGITIGAIFPFFAKLLLGTNSIHILTFKFFVACIISGILVGLISYYLLQITLLKEIEVFHEKMAFVKGNIQDYKDGKIQTVDGCENCFLDVTSTDLVGEIQEDFNKFVSTIKDSFANFEQLDELFRRLNKSSDLEKLNASMLHFLGETYEEIIAAEIFNLDGGTLHLAASSFKERKVSSKDLQLYEDILEMNQPYMLDDDNIVLHADVFSIKAKSLLALPINDADDKYGVLVLYLKLKNQFEFSKKIRRLLNQYILAYKIAISYHKIKDLASRDELMQINNRRTGMKLFQRILRDAHADGTSVCAVMIDLDNFKEINDNHGHQAGDFILKSVAEIIQYSVRSTDVIMRYGGEELAIMLPDIGVDKAFDKSEMIRKKVAENTFNWNNTSLNISFSAGVSCSCEDLASNYDLNNLLYKADVALYRAKDQGKNRTLIYTECRGNDV